MVAMATLQNSTHFFPEDQILQIDGMTSFREVYQRLHQQGQGAFFLTENEEVRSFVRAYLLAEAVVSNAVKRVNSIPGPTAEERNDALRDEIRMISDKQIELVVRDTSQWSPIVVVPIDQTSIGLNADENRLWNREEQVFEVREGGERIGWYLNHESVADPVTEKTIYRCTNPNDPHNNTDTDHGTCYQCPFPIGAVNVIRSGAQ